jgi:hypothetical protein
VWLVLPDGRSFSGAQAVFLLMELGEGRTWPAALYTQPARFRDTQRVRLSTHRASPNLVLWITRFLWGKHVEPAASG